MLYKTSLRFLVFALAAFALTACVTDYSRFYHELPGATPEAIAAMRVAPPTGTPIVEHAPPPKTNAAAMYDAYARRGYVPIGMSAFNSWKAESENAAIRQGRHVDADLVLILNPHYTGSTNAIVPVVVPTYATSRTNIDGSVVVGSGTGSISGTATTVTEFDSTVLTPVTLYHVDYGAIYFIKRKFSFGAMFRALNDAERQQLQSNKGVFVRAVVDNSPAYYADILNGDIIVKIGDEEVTDLASATGLIKRYAGQQVFVTVYRNGNRFAKPVMLK